MNERRGTKGLELWCRKMTEGYPGVKIDNMTTSWRDGLAFCAIIHHFRPDLIDFSKLNKDDIYQNNELAFTVAEKYLGIPALLDPEDMEKCSVPDRLCILTYLSQFYQTFAARQGASPARIAPKRPQSSSDHGIVSPASTSPPTKVAFTGAVPRREPCRKCCLPVFIAERLNVGKHLFHRTCFRCARCNSQLNLANYYETESNEFCCEVCPDEEKVMAKTTAANAVLQRSMSDEEKSASLKNFTNDPDEFSAIFESALDNADLEKVRTLSRELDSARSGFFQSQIESSDSGNDIEEPQAPDLPKNLPPASEILSNEHPSIKYDSGFPSKDVSDKTSFSSSVESQNVVTKDAGESIVKARMRLFENNKKADVNNEPVPLSNFTPIPFSIKNVDSIKSSDKHTPHSSSQDSLENNGKQFPETKFTSSINIEMSPEPEEINNSDVSRNLSEEVEQEMLSKNDVDSNVPPVTLDESKDLSIISISDSSGNMSSRINEAIEAINDAIGSIQNSSYINIQSTDSQSIQDSISINMIDDSIVIDTNTTGDSLPKENIQETTKDTDIHEAYNINDATQFPESLENPTVKPIDNKPVEAVNIVKVIAKEDTIVEANNYNVKDLKYLKEEPLLTQDDTAKDVTYQKEEPVLEAHTDVKTKDIDKLIEASNYNIKNVAFDDDVKDVETQTKIPKPDLKKTESYPDDLNPFDDISEDPLDTSLNPFGSDDDDEDIQIVPIKKPVPSPRFKKKVISAADCHSSPIEMQEMKRISVNPFDNSEGEDDKQHPVPAVRRKKISVPKLSLNPFSSDEEMDDSMNKPMPVPRNSTRTSSRISEQKPGLGSHQNFGGSNSSLSSGSYYGSTRKKRPAPKPPILGLLDDSNSSKGSTPCQSVHHSPKSTPKYRKNRRAPAPPNFSSTPVTGGPKHSPKDVKHGQQDAVEKEKTVKDEVNRTRQTRNLLNQPSNIEQNAAPVPDKSTYGQWKRKKGQAPPKPVPQKRSLKCLPMSEIKKELEFIEVQQQGLEKQGVRLEQIIREKCEGSISEHESADDIPIEVEDLILQLFEIVNEKNELFRKQTELMYLRRQQRLEEEHADVEYQIRCLMMQPEVNKTDSDKAREEELIKRLVEIVERRNEIVECLEMDRVREAEEDVSISNHINLFTMSRECEKQTIEKDKDEEKHKKKKEKKKSKHKSKNKVDADKDVDTKEAENLEKKKKKKFNLF